MSVVLAEDLARCYVRDRREAASLAARATRLAAAARWQRRADQAADRARAARAALR